MVKYGSNIFEGCSSLQYVTITTHSVSTYGPLVTFQGLRNLRRVILIEAVSGWSGLPSDIGSYRFQGCSSLFDINIPNSIRMIGDNAFKGKIAYTHYYYY